MFFPQTDDMIDHCEPLRICGCGEVIDAPLARYCHACRAAAIEMLFLDDEGGDEDEESGDPGWD